MTRIGRRELLAGATSMSALVVSGCLSRARDELGGQSDSTDDPGNPDTSDGNGTDPDDGNGTDPDDGNGDEPAPDQSAEGADVTDSPGIDGASIETLESDCGSPDDDGIAVDVAENTVVVDGVLPAPNPCHEAVLADVALDGETLSVVIDVADTTAEDEGCIMCHGKVEYLAEVEPVDLSEAESVAVTHETGDRHTTEIDPDDSEDGGDPDKGPIEQASIETVDTGCGSGDEAITIDFDDGEVGVTGVVSTPNPCHEAVLDSVTVEDDHLSVVVAPRSTLQEGDVCVQCIGAIEYEARIVPSDVSAVETVTVEHASGTESTATR
jgi:hypothetical protein